MFPSHDGMVGTQWPKGEKVDPCKAAGDSPKPYANCNKSNSTGYTMHGSTDMTFWKRRPLRNINRISGLEDDKEKMGALQKGWRELFGVMEIFCILKLPPK